jgi:hypothetical protein
MTATSTCLAHQKGTYLMNDKPGMNKHNGDPMRDLQLLRDLAIVNARTAHELGALPPGGLPVQEKRKPDLPKRATMAHPAASTTSSDASLPDGTHAMNTPPATQDEYWDRLVELSRETDGKPSVEQIRDAFGMTPEQLAEIEQRVRQKFGGRDVDRVWAYEMLQSIIESWEGTSISWTSKEYEKFGEQTEKSQAISFATSKILLGIGNANPDDLHSMEESYRKFSMLIEPLRPFRMTREEALRRLAEWEKHRG